MRKQYFKTLLFTLLINLLLLGCSATYPKTLSQNPKIDNDISIILLGIKGNKKVNYLQFCANELPCINYRFKPVTNTILALRVPMPKTNLKLNVYSAGHHGYIGPISTSYGYVPITSENITITKQGIYFYGVLDTDSASFNPVKDKTLIGQAKNKYVRLLHHLKPINFQW